MFTHGRFRHLILIFCSWKILLLGLTAFCPGPGYDTSALIMLNGSIDRHETFAALPRIGRLSLNLFRWDALYFVDAAERGYVHEQQWAFSWAYSHLLRVLGQCERSPQLKRIGIDFQQSSPAMRSHRCSATLWLGSLSPTSAIYSPYLSFIVFSP